MKILNVNCTIDKETGGGTAERTLKMSESLQLSGQDCSILSLNIGDLTATRKKLKDVKFILLPCFIKRYYIPVLSFQVLSLIKKTIKKADIIHIMSHWSILNVLLYYYTKKYKIPYVICPAGSMIVFGRSQILKALYNRFVGKKIIRDAAACIAITEDEVITFRQFEVESERIALIPNGVSEGDFLFDSSYDFRKAYNLNQKPYILFVGRLNLIKGPDILLNAFIVLKGQLSDFHLVFAGPDEGMKAGLQDAAKIGGVEKRVHFVGYLNQEQKSKAYQDSSFVVIPSRHEAMSIVVLEAGILKRPVLLSDQCGLNVLEKNDTAIVKPASESGICEGLIEMRNKLTEDPKFGDKLYRYVNDNYAWGKITKKFESLYDSIKK